MFGSLGLPEILVILVLALLIFGPKRLPEVGRTIGKGLSEFRRATTDLKRSVNAELSLEDEERPSTTRRPPQGVGRTMAEASRTRESTRELPASGPAPEGTAPRGGDSESDPEGSTAADAPGGNAPAARAEPETKTSEPAAKDRASDDSATNAG